MAALEARLAELVTENERLRTENAPGPPSGIAAGSAATPAIATAAWPTPRSWRRWPAARVAEDERQEDRIRDHLLARCRAELIEPPSADRITEIVRSALHQGAGKNRVTSRKPPRGVGLGAPITMPPGDRARLSRQCLFAQLVARCLFAHLVAR